MEYVKVEEEGSVPGEKTRGDERGKFPPSRSSRLIVSRCLSSHSRASEQVVTVDICAEFDKSISQKRCSVYCLHILLKFHTSLI